jgi:hypothetical protein
LVIEPVAGHEGGGEGCHGNQRKDADDGEAGTREENAPAATIERADEAVRTRDLIAPEQ